ncbi:MAG: type II secretion system F family protein, partial [Proteobacteria bacterium]|nr:type II secretion system F family protein [Pseudomonadota bacterium]
MVEFVSMFLEPQFLIMVLSAVAAFATIATVTLGAMTGDRMNARMKYVSSEREKMRAERLAQLADQDKHAKLRNQPKGFMKQIVEQLNLRKLLETESTREKLKMAGMRGQAPVVAFLFFRLVLPFVTFAAAFL